MIVLLGDIHGEFLLLSRVISKYPEATIIQLGDFGYWPQFRAQWVRPRKDVYFIDGNHDYLPHLMKRTKPKMIWPGLIYCPRGCILELERVRYGFMGGALSVDRKMRPKGGQNHGWFEDEVASEWDVEALVQRKPDVVLAHAPPASTIEFYDGLVHQRRERFLRMFNLSSDWQDVHAQRMEPLKQLGVPYYCGHMHTSFKHQNVQILDIGEAVPL